MSETTFLDLVTRAQTRGPKTDPPVTRTEIARRCGISRQHLYLLIDGKRKAQQWVVERIAKGLSLSVPTVNRALRASRAVAGILA